MKTLIIRWVLVLIALALGAVVCQAVAWADILFWKVGWVAAVLAPLEVILLFPVIVMQLHVTPGSYFDGPWFYVPLILLVFSLWSFLIVMIWTKRRKALWIVLFVVACIMPLVFSLHPRRTPARISPGRERVQGLGTAIDTYEVDTGHYPPSLDALLVQGVESDWHGPYVRSTNTFLDAWGHAFRYRHVVRGKDDFFELRSAGPDGVFNTEDDISN